MDAVFLSLGGRDLGEAKGAEKGQQVEAQAGLVALDPAGAPLALGDDLVFAFEKLRSLPEGLFVKQLAAPILFAQRQVPVLGELLRQVQAFFLGADALVAGGEIGRALPEAAVLALVDVDLVTENRVRIHNRPPRWKMCKVCERVTGPEGPVKKVSKLLI